VKGKVLNPTSMPYERVCLGKNGNEKTFSVHQLVARVFIRPPKEGEEINHIDCNPSNNHAENLEWVTHAENERHAVENERRSGEMQSNSKLTSNDVRAIRKTYRTEDVTYSDLASSYSVSKGLIGMVVRGERWSHID
jgi:DNA polymerase elongation subunit (family B)